LGNRQRCRNLRTRFALPAAQASASGQEEPFPEQSLSGRDRSRYAPGKRGLWVKVKCLHREEFVVVAGPIPKARGRISARCHWVRPELVAEVKFLSWTDDNLLRQVVYEGLREDKPAVEVRRPVPHPTLATVKRG
jgi:bifunctional non-homologous end joining protein LigD